jgi:uncharacterized protein
MSEKLPPDDSKWSRFFSSLFRKRSIVLSLFFFSSLLFLLLTFRIQLKADILDLLPARDPLVANYRLIQTSFKQLDLMLIDIGPGDNQKPVSDIELMAVADHLTGLLNRSKLFRQVEGRISFEEIDQTLQIFSKHKINLFTAEDQIMLEKKLTPSAIRESLSQWKKQLHETPAPYVTQVFLRDPLNIDEMLLEKLNFTGISVSKLKVRNGWMFTPDLQHVLLLCEPRYAAGDETRSGELTTFMTSAIRQAEAAAANRDVGIAYIANHRFTQINAALLRSDIKRTMTFSLLSISIIVILVFRRPMLFGILTLLTACFGGLFATAIMVLLFKDVSAISIGCGAMLMGILVDFSIHILYHLDQNEQCTRTVIIRTLSELAKPLLITAGTTLIAFMALLFSLLPGYRQIGVFASLGIIGSLVFSIVGIPLLIPRLKPRRGPVLAVTKIYLPFFKWSQENRKLVLLILLLITAITGLGVTRLEFDGDVRNLNASTPGIDRDVSRIIKTYGDPTMVTSIAVKGSNLEEALKRNDLLFRELIALQKKGYIQSISSIAPIVLPSSVQRENFERWKTFWGKERVSRLRNDVQAVAAEMRLRPESLFRFLETIPGDTSFLTVQDLEISRLTKPLATRIAPTQGGFLVLSSFEPTTIGSTKPIVSLLKSRVPGVFAADGQSLVRRMVKLVKQEMTKLGSITLFFVALAMVSYAKRPAQFLRLILPLLISLFWTFGIMGWLGLKLNIVNDMVVVFVFGLVDDYCLFLYTAWRKFLEGHPDFLTYTSGAITISAATTILGALALTLARHPALHSMGTTALLGISMGLVASFLIIPHSRS